MLNNPARQLYTNMDIDNLEEEKEVTSTGLLSPRKQMSNISKSASQQPAFRVAQHMKTLRKKRGMLNNGN
jgi:hypothetical protein